MPLMFNTCVYCGRTEESFIRHVPPQIVVECGVCEKIIGYQTWLPDVNVIKKAIFDLVGGDIKYIEEVKKQTGFKVHVVTLYQQVEYYNLYMQLLLIEKLPF